MSQIVNRYHYLRLDFLFLISILFFFRQVFSFRLLHVTLSGKLAAECFIMTGNVQETLFHMIYN